MPVSIDAGDRSTELGQVSRNHAVMTFEYLATQSELDPVSDVEQMQNLLWDVGKSYLLLFDKMLQQLC